MARVKATCVGPVTHVHEFDQPEVHPHKCQSCPFPVRLEVLTDKPPVASSEIKLTEKDDGVSDPLRELHPSGDDRNAEQFNGDTESAP